MASESKIVVTFLYPKVDNFDFGYYLSRHIPSTQKAWESLGLANCIVCDCTGDDQYTAIVSCHFKDLESWENAAQGQAAKDLTADVKNFTNVPPVMVVGKVVN